MKPSSILQFAIKPAALLALTLSITIFTIFFSSPSQSAIASASMASRSFILWLHGLGDSGPANEPIKSVFSSPQLANTRWSFPSAPFQPVTCNSKSQSLINQLIPSCMFDLWCLVIDRMCA
ncbi:putative phospholipase/carboxylesterase/thioesterase, alpha/Beta hydrolase [Helianthus annuus]|nr:putative phospholipase/carboxylesterase/thioesterase, alpha/Beta hydrolase [Helianthus annuus]